MSELPEQLQQQALIDEAEARIQRILIQLEKDTNSYIKSMSIEEMDLTRLADARKKYLRRVEIDVYPLPGYRWVS